MRGRDDCPESGETISATVLYRTHVLTIRSAIIQYIIDIYDIYEIVGVSDSLEVLQYLFERDQPPGKLDLKSLL